jgi:hypothetical protein
MADTKISALTGATTPVAGTEVLPIVQSGTTVNVSIANLTAGRNVTGNIFYAGFTNVAAAGTTTTLTSSSTPNYVVTGSGGQTFKLPDATTLSPGILYTFNNNQSSGTITVINNSSTTITTVQSGGFVTISLLTNSVAAGTWDYHFGAPSNVSWSTNTFSYPGTITSATWNGGVVPVLYGGTGVTTSTGTGSVVLSTSPSLTTPVLGTPTSGTLTNCTGYTTANLSGTISNAQLANSTISGVSLGGSLANLTAGTNITFSSGTTYNGSAAITINASSSAQVYPGAGIANSTGSAWGTSYTTSGSGTVVALNNTPTITNPTITNYVETLYAPSAGSAFTISLANGTVQEISLNANGTITLPSSTAGKSFTIIVTYSGSYSLTWAGGGTLKWAGGTTPTATSTSGKYDIFNFYQDGTNTYGSVFGLNY